MRGFQVTIPLGMGLRKSASQGANKEGLVECHNLMPIDGTLTEPLTVNLISSVQNAAILLITQAGDTLVTQSGDSLRTIDGD